ncbi:hypothetical protein HY489_00620 [Candidatus Woesearchaeota archaeon]|nr:hypothetical protein [Candidatus Woesearchaeota archaeon]
MASRDLTKLFEEEDKVVASIREISQSLLDLSDFTLAKSAVELAKAEVVGKRLRNACDLINEELHGARKKLGVLLSSAKKVKFKGRDRLLHEMEDELSLIHGDVEAIGTIAESFYKAESREIAFENMNKHYAELMQHVLDLMGEESSLGK